MNISINQTSLSPIQKVPDSQLVAAALAVMAKLPRSAREVIVHCIMNHLNMPPLRHFIQDFTVRDSWRYAGKGVKLCDKARLVCWYQLKKTKQYRAVYGDLSVKDVSIDDLPKDVKP